MNKPLNRSQLFINAWAIYRTGKTFSQALKYAWTKLKKIMEKNTFTIVGNGEYKSFYLNEDNINEDTIALSLAPNTSLDHLSQVLGIDIRQDKYTKFLAEYEKEYKLTAHQAEALLAYIDFQNNWKYEYAEDKTWTGFVKHETNQFLFRSNTETGEFTFEIKQ